MPPRTSVHFLDPLLWRPLAFERLPPRGSRGLRGAVGKLAAGVSLDQARAELNTISGRTLDDSDRTGSPFVVVINEAFARTYLPGQEPLGERLLMRRIPFEAGVSAAGPGRRSDC